MMPPVLGALARSYKARFDLPDFSAGGMVFFHQGLSCKALASFYSYTGSLAIECGRRATRMYVKLMGELIDCFGEASYAAYCVW